jgi:hypothetical protein
VEGVSGAGAGGRQLRDTMEKPIPVNTLAVVVGRTVLASTTTNKRNTSSELNTTKQEGVVSIYTHVTKCL